MLTWPSYQQSILCDKEQEIIKLKEENLQYECNALQKRKAENEYKRFVLLMQFGTK